MEVDAPGCSYNPDREQHEEIVAAAVAEEMQKGLEAEMRGKGPPKFVSWQPEADPMLQLQVRSDSPVPQGSWRCAALSELAGVIPEGAPSVVAYV